MILQIGADAGPVEHDWNAKLLQLLRRTDAGQHHDLRRADRAGGEDDFTTAARRPRLSALGPAHAGGTPAVEHDAFGQAAGFEPQIGAFERRLEEGTRRRPAPAALLVDVEGADAFVVAAVEVGNGFDAGLFGGGAKGIEQVPAHPRRRHVPLAADRVRLAFAEEMIFVALEIRQHVVPAPAAQAELAPVIVVGGLAAHIDHGVDRRRAADHLAARIIEAAAVEAFLWLGLKTPVGARIADGEQIADRNVKPDPVVAAAGFENEHALAGVGRELIGQNAAGRARAGDDVVVFAVNRLCRAHRPSCAEKDSTAVRAARSRGAATPASLVRAPPNAYCFGATDGALSARRKGPERRFPEAVVATSRIMWS